MNKFGVKIGKVVNAQYSPTTKSSPDGMSDLSGLVDKLLTCFESNVIRRQVIFKLIHLISCRPTKLFNCITNQVFHRNIEVLRQYFIEFVVF